jgi:hypothetical protein
MKKVFPVFVILLSVILSACASQKAYSAPARIPVGNPSTTIVASPTEGTLNMEPPSSGQTGPEISTTLPDNGVTPAAGSASTPTAGLTSSPASITLEDKGKTFTFQIGDSFLLNLGDGVYEWTVTVDNQDVVALKVGVLVIKGAQGIFNALAPGTATLTAVGDPLCRKLTPPCMIPTILFKVTLIVQ